MFYFKYEVKGKSVVSSRIYRVNKYGTNLIEAPFTARYSRFNVYGKNSYSVDGESLTCDLDFEDSTKGGNLSDRYNNYYYSNRSIDGERCLNVSNLDKNILDSIPLNTESPFSGYAFIDCIVINI